MSWFWVVFDDRSDGCIKSANIDAARTEAEAAKPGRRAVEVHVLPYRGRNILNDNGADEPPFCTSPNTCRGRTSCPKSYACSE